MLSIFFFKQKTAYEMRISDWSSDVCSSDLAEALDLAPPPQGRQTKARAPVVIGLDDRAEDACEIADFLGNQEVALHEALDVQQAGVRVEAHARRDLLLHVEGEALVGAAGEIVHVAAQGPQEILRLLEAAHLRSEEHTS